MNIKNYANSLGIKPDDTDSLENLRDVLYDIVALCANRAGMVDDGAAHAVMDLISDDSYLDVDDEIRWSDEED